MCYIICEFHFRIAVGTIGTIRRRKCWFLDSEPLLWRVRGPQKEICSSPLLYIKVKGNEVHSLEVRGSEHSGRVGAKLDVLSKQEGTGS